MNWKTPQKRKSVPRLLSMILDATNLLELTDLLDDISVLCRN